MPGWSALREDLIARVPAVEASSPGMATPAAQNWIVHQVELGNFVPPIWWPMSIAISDDVAGMVMIAAEPLRLGIPGDSVSPIVSQKTAELIARELGVVVPTAKLLDHAGLSGAVINFKASNVADISLAHMESYSAWLDSKRLPGALAIGGKQWVNSAMLNHPQALKPYGALSGINYGAWTMQPAVPGGFPRNAASTTAIRVYQPEANAHDIHHTDYSQQSPQLVQRGVRIVFASGDDPIDLDIADVAADPALSAIVSQAGPLAMSHPAVISGPNPQGPPPGGPPPGGPPGPTTPAGWPLSSPGGRRLAAGAASVAIASAAFALGRNHHA